MAGRIPSTVLLIDDDEDVLTSLSLYLKLHFERVLSSATPVRINELISENDIDLVLLDMNFRKGTNDGKEGLYWLSHIKELKPQTAVVLVTAYGSIELAVEGLKRGASDFVVKPWNNQKLLKTLIQVLELNKARKKPGPEEKNLSPKNSPAGGEEQFQPLSAQMTEVLAMARKVASTDANILITGENGTGKEVMARYIHQHSLRAKQPMVALDLGAVSENLFEAELFGYKKGAFTDAKEDKAGRFELAQGGTLFLDEIGNIPLGLQSRLLTAIQTRTISPVGGTASLHIDCRIICATNLNLERAVREGNFRQDLLYRINTIEINLPPLRERNGDIAGLAEHFLSKFNQRYHKDSFLAAETLEAMKTYHWPGNIRELQHTIERSVILADERKITPEDLRLSERHSPDTAGETEVIDLEELEKRHIMRILKKFDGNISHAAKALKINRNTLYRKIEKYGL